MNQIEKICLVLTIAIPYCIAVYVLLKFQELKNKMYDEFLSLNKQVLKLIELQQEMDEK